LVLVLLLWSWSCYFGLGLVTLVLVLLLWSWSCYFGLGLVTLVLVLLLWSWSCYFGFGLRLKNLVLFTSLKCRGLCLEVILSGKFHIILLLQQRACLRVVELLRHWQKFVTEFCRTPTCSRCSVGFDLPCISRNVRQIFFYIT